MVCFTTAYINGYVCRHTVLELVTLEIEIKTSFIYIVLYCVGIAASTDMSWIIAHVAAGDPRTKRALPNRSRQRPDC